MKTVIFSILFCLGLTTAAQAYYPPPPAHYPGWHQGWQWNQAWRPHWYQWGMQFPAYNWSYGVPQGYWQCVAFNGYMQAFYGIGYDINQAAYGALYYCGGAYNGCYIPPNYCQVRYW